ncbi:hypothetical protein ACFSKW_41025 [Nonomuraea mangrovi]|uniref:WD40 repeat domain-containing protein n=1 Tax=Nonomuraea mangrovi TaxID=2316207 RepID=A0ABW4TBZ9_9ACTN
MRLTAALPAALVALLAAVAGCTPAGGTSATAPRSGTSTQAAQGTQAAQSTQANQNTQATQAAQPTQEAVPGRGAAAETARHGPGDPMPPVSGRPLEPGSGLRLLVTGEGEVFRLDVDSRVRTRVRGLPYGERTWAFTAGSRELVMSTPDDADAGGRLFLLTGDRARPLGGTALFAFAAADGKGVWTLQRVRADECRLRPLDFRGRERGRALRVACSRAPAQDTPQGLLSFAEQERALLLDRATGQEVFAEQRVHAVTRDLVLVSKGSQPDPALVEPEAARRTPLPAPDTEGTPSTAEVSPDGRRIALWFADPAWPGPRQYLDVQVLDLGTRTWTRLPSMPVPASIKSTSMAWTRDGRLVLAGDFVTTGKVMPAEFDYASFVVAWRPGESLLSLRRLDLPPHHRARLSP